MGSTLGTNLAKGIEAYKFGQLLEAENCYGAVVREQPRHPDSNYNLGVLSFKFGKFEEGLAFFKTALQVNPLSNQFCKLILVL